MTTAAVIGSGFGGLALAIRLQSAGIQTTLIEARDKPGGRAYVFEDDGFKFDAGPTVITDPTCLEELFGLSGRKLSDYVELISVAPFYRLLWEDGTVFDYSNDEEALFAEIHKVNPKDVAGYKKFLEFSDNVFREGYQKLGHEAFLDFRLNSVMLSAQAVDVIKLHMAGNAVSREASGLSIREWDELVSRFPALNSLPNS